MKDDPSQVVADIFTEFEARIDALERSIAIIGHLAFRNPDDRAMASEWLHLAAEASRRENAHHAAIETFEVLAKAIAADSAPRSG